METQEQAMDWGESKTASEVTISELKQLCQKYKESRAEKEKIAAELKEQNKALAKIEAKIVEYLTENDMKNFSGEFGQVSLTKRVSVKQPATPEAKAEFYSWLQAKGDFEHLISINSRTLTKYVRDEIEIKQQEGEYGFIPPGLEGPETTRTISFRKG